MHFFQNIQINDWRQFATVDIDLSRSVTVLTGQNGSGKTTLLTILNRHFGWELQFVSTPFWGKRRSKRFWSDVKHARSLDFDAEQGAGIDVGSVEYDNGEVCRLNTQTITNAQYHLSYSNQQPVVGIHIPSHRPPATYHSVDSIPTNPTSVQEHYQNFQQLLMQTYGSSNRVQNPGVIQKQSLIALALFGYGNEAVQGNSEYREIFEAFQRVLQALLPEDLGFERMEVRMPEVVLVTRTGEFSLDAMSGGVNALFGIAWQIHMYKTTQGKCTVTIDEPENHLHPSMQRALLPSLTRAFPNHRFVVATHSPFIVSSSPEASVYGLVFREDQKVHSQALDTKELSGTPDKILREILDVPSNLPLWVEERIAKILADTPDGNPTERAKLIMESLRELGLADSIPDLPWESDDA